MTIWIDLTSSLRWAEQPVGIIRSELEIVRHLLEASESRVRFCQFRAYRGPIQEVPLDVVRGVVSGVARRGSQNPRVRPVARRALDRLTRLLRPSAERRAATPFQSGDIYVSVGMDAWDRDLSVLDTARRELNLAVVTTCYDLVPYRLPHLVNEAERHRIPEHLRTLAKLSDVVMCISDDTLSDFRAFLATEGLRNVKLSRIRLGAEIESPEAAPPSFAKRLEHDFIIYVSSLSRRKNHELLYRVYSWAGSLGISLPQMIFVGRGTPESKELQTLMALDPNVADRIVHIADASDQDVRWLYQNCMFTVFPSLAEGWGLPVAESTLFRKPCLAANLPAVREIAGELHQYLDPYSTDQWLGGISRLASDSDERDRRVGTLIASNWQRGWRDAADDVLLACELAVTERLSGKERA